MAVDMAERVVIIEADAKEIHGSSTTLVVFLQYNVLNLQITICQ